MSFGRQQHQQIPANPMDHPQILGAVLEMQQISNMVAKMNSACFKKCIASVAEADLSVGEMACVDRCVGKFMLAAEKVGAKLQEAQQNNQAGAGGAPL
jgi:uncharacterized ParB-like nuclease family protein